MEEMLSFYLAVNIYNNALVGTISGVWAQKHICFSCGPILLKVCYLLLFWLQNIVSHQI